MVWGWGTWADAGTDILMIQSLEALALIVATLVFMFWVELWYGGNREQKQDI